MNKSALMRCRELICGNPGGLPSGLSQVVPVGLHDEYEKVAVLEEVAESLPEGIVESTFARLILTSSESDQLRVRCVELLMECRSSTLGFAFTGLIFDPDPEMRLMGLEGLIVTKHQALKTALIHLENDTAAEISAMVQAVRSGRPISVTYVDFPRK